MSKLSLAELAKRIEMAETKLLVLSRHYDAVERMLNRQGDQLRAIEWDLTALNDKIDEEYIDDGWTSPLQTERDEARAWARHYYHRCQELERSIHG